MTKRQLIEAIRQLDTDLEPNALQKSTKADLQAQLDQLMAEIREDILVDDDAAHHEAVTGEAPETAGPTPEDDTTEAPTPMPDLAAVAAASAAAKAKPATRTPKTIHSLIADGSTLCNIAGTASDDADQVTCKVCLAKINGTKPVNALSDEIKAARKQFASFKARIGYMLYMDRPSNAMAIDAVDWTLSYTNTAGIRYEATGRNSCVRLSDSEGGLEDFYVKSDLDDTITKLGWEAW